MKPEMMRKEAAVALGAEEMVKSEAVSGKKWEEEEGDEMSLWQWSFN